MKELMLWYLHVFIEIDTLIMTKQLTSKKQLTEVFSEKRCSDKLHEIHRKTPVSESLF